MIKKTPALRMDPNESSILMGRQDMSLNSASYIPNTMTHTQANFIGNADDFDEPSNDASRVEPVLRTQTNHHTQIS
jgi:hypothetical protein